jgi:hypothetical protein
MGMYKYQLSTQAVTTIEEYQIGGSLDDFPPSTISFFKDTNNDYHVFTAGGEYKNYEHQVKDRF